MTEYNIQLNNALVFEFRLQYQKVEICKGRGLCSMWKKNDVCWLQFVSIFGWMRGPGAACLSRPAIPGGKGQTRLCDAASLGILVIGYYCDN
jgi:hypothetical protein